MPEATPQGSTVQDAANAIESLLTAAEAAPTEETAPAEEVPEPEAPQEPEETEETPNEAADEAAEEAPTLYTVKVDGEEKQVTPQELVNGYQFAAANTRRAQELAATRKEAEELRTAAAQERALYAQLLPAIQAVLVDSEQQPNWDQLFEENPNEAVKLKYQWDKKQAVAEQARLEQQRIAQVQQQEHRQNMQKVLADEANRLVEAVPEWKNQKIADAEKKELIQAAIKAGYSENDVSQVTDHRAVVILRKAMLYDKMQATRAGLKPATPVVKSAPPSSNQTSTPTSELTKAKQRLAKTGSVKDAALAIEQML